jgi:hypothetical protein
LTSEVCKPPESFRAARSYSDAANGELSESPGGYNAGVSFTQEATTMMPDEIAETILSAIPAALRSGWTYEVGPGTQPMLQLTFRPTTFVWRPRCSS